MVLTTGCLLRSVDWFQLAFLAFPPLLLYYGSSHVHYQSKTLIWQVLLQFLGGVSITAGYHRLWSHRSYQASRPLKYFLAAFGASTCQWSIMWWVRHHRAHHRYVDTDRDPYNAKRGLFYSHVGWLLMRNGEQTWGKVDLSDLKEDPIVVWQQRYYVAIAAITGLILPVSVAHFGWDDLRGGLVYATCFRLVWTWHVTFCINSLAHWAGTQPFSTRSSARNNWLLGFVSLGEGWHNFHHAFPYDYRNGVHWYQADITKWCIWVWEKLGLAKNLKRIHSRPKVVGI
ncbi:hypothetical protein BDV32DRAFT_141422 [Aspergillus pseudonomiae]|nr:hypothetical protein BDV32DRAFT_141422 [Aspergillus pseudonomiae]